MHKEPYEPADECNRCSCDDKTKKAQTGIKMNLIFDMKSEKETNLEMAEAMEMTGIYVPDNITGNSLNPSLNDLNSTANGLLFRNGTSQRLFRNSFEDSPSKLTYGITKQFFNKSHARTSFIDELPNKRDGEITSQFFNEPFEETRKRPAFIGDLINEPPFDREIKDKFFSKKTSKIHSKKLKEKMKNEKIFRDELPTDGCESSMSNGDSVQTEGSSAFINVKEKSKEINKFRKKFGKLVDEMNKIRKKREKMLELERDIKQRYVKLTMKMRQRGLPAIRNALFDGQKDNCFEEKECESVINNEMESNAIETLVEMLNCHK